MAEGTELGARANYIYVTDDGVQKIVLTLDATLGDLSGTGLTRYGGEADVCKNFKGFKPRGVYWSYQPAGGGRPIRKFLICNLNGTFYKTITTTAIQIGGNDGATTGRRGEQYTFLQATPTGGSGGGGTGGTT